MGIDRWQYRGARAIVILHERELRHFLDTWKAAKARNLALSETKYKPEMTLEDILVHVLHWARDYVVWSCEKLQLPDPGIAPIPAVGDVASEVDSYVDHLLKTWREPFRALPEDVFWESHHRTPWGKNLQVETLLEHAVVHPMRHRLQFEELMDGASDC
ncbi:hypothetical protein ACGF5M_01020 [Gemmatimonadota bacterium]